LTIVNQHDLTKLELYLEIKMTQDTHGYIT